MSKTIKIVKQKGEVKNKEFVLSRLGTIFPMLANGEHILTIKKNVQKRTLSQNAMMWMWFACLGIETGSDKDEFHDYYCSKFLVRYSNIANKERRIVGGTSKLDTVAMTDFLNKVQADAATEFGITLPTPQDLYWQEFENEYKRFMY